MVDLAALKRTRGGHCVTATRRKFDEHILPLVDPGVLDKEIEDSEPIKDELFLAMSTVDRALLTLPLHTPASTSTSSPVRPLVVSAKLPKFTLMSFNRSLVVKIDNFSYLQSLLEGKAQETIAGFALADANYSTAVELLEKRFDKERITAAYVDLLMSLDKISSDHHIFELRCLYDKTEYTIRSLPALAVPVD
uniref:Uncharacterized protein n=1 Tax=Amphimedon queenslandica TaxID=400682 RepID=A0A1X7V087_AMPQE